MANEHVNKVTLGSETLIDITDTTAEASDVASGKVFYLASGASATGTASYAAAPVNNGNAAHTNAFLFGYVDSTSTATDFTATVEGLTALYDGVAVMLHNGIVTSASGFVLNVNNLGDKPVYSNMATGDDITPTAPTRDTTIFNINYTMLFVYDSQLVDGGAWICYRGYDANTNTIGYQLRTNSGRKPAADKGYRYRIWLTSADGASWVPINTSTATDATTSRSLNTRKIDPFGPIAYNSTNGTCNAAANLPAATMWRVYTLTIGYSYVKTLTAWDPVYLKCTPQSDGSAVMADIVQALPGSDDGYIYIHLGTAYSTTAMELQAEHPVYWHDGTGIRIWTGAEPSSGGGSKTTWYGTCSTSGAAKDVTCEGYVLESGAMISVLFTQANSAGQPTLNVNGTGAKALYVGNTNTFSDTNPLKWRAYTLVTVVYDGTHYRLVAASAAASVSQPRGANTWYGTCNNAETTAAKTSDNILNFVPTEGAVVLINASKANTYTAGALSLNVNSTGAKTIYKGGAATSATNTLTWAAGDMLTFVLGEGHWHYVGGGSTEGSYTLPTASASTLGGVKVGSGLSIDSSGVLSASGGSGGVSMATATATLPASGWSSDSITVNVTGVTASNNVLVAPAPASVSAYAAAGIVCTAQGAGTLTFTRTSANTAAITVNVLILS